MAADNLSCAVTALCFLKALPDSTYLCAGVGPYLRMYRLNEETHLPAASNDFGSRREIQLFPAGTRIHGIVTDSAHCGNDPVLVVRGGRYVATVAFHAFQESSSKHRSFVVRTFPEWVLDARRLRQRPEDGSVPTVVTLAHGDMHVCDSRTLETQNAWTAPARELYWCLSVRESACRRLCAAAGTSFGQIVLWALHPTFNSYECAGLQVRLAGHDGPVMRTQFSDDDDRTWLASASVDRTVRLWRLLPSARNAANAEPELRYVSSAVFFGHTARAWHLALCKSSEDLSTPPRVFSVGEDRTLRLWPRVESRVVNGGAIYNKPTQNHQFPQDVFHGHSGRNVWTVSCLARNYGCKEAENVVTVATGGDDGIIQIRHVPLDPSTVGASLHMTDEEQPRDSGIESSEKISDGLDTHFPRAVRNGSAAEAVQSIFMLSPSIVVVSTSYGRILAGISADREGQAHVGALPVVSWTVLFEELEDLTFAPNALYVRRRSLIIAGTTEGMAVFLHVGASKSGLSLNGEALKIAAFGRVCRLMTGVYADGALCGDVNELVRSCAESGQCSGLHYGESGELSIVNAFFASMDGALYQWQIRTAGTDLKHATSNPVAVYKQERSVRYGLVTSVLTLTIGGQQHVMVGDRRGFLHLYKQSSASESQMVSDNPIVIHPVSFSRPHQDRVSSLIHSPVNTARNRTMFGDGRSHVLSIGFDGRLVEIRVEVSTMDTEPMKDAEDVACHLKYTMTVVDRVRCAERLDTLVAVTFARSVDGSPLTNRRIVAGFRSAQLVVWDMSQRVMLLRADIGGWRRALGLCLEVEADSAADPLRVRACTSAFWRNGILRLVSSKPDGLASIGAGFHGLRAHSATVLPSGPDGVPEILTSSEDTTLHLTRLAERPGSGAWSTVQVLSGHTSGVNTVSAGLTLESGSEGEMLAVSGGGMDEMLLWWRPSGQSAWVLAGVHTAPRSTERSAPRHRVMCASLYMLRPGKARCGLLEDTERGAAGRNTAMALVGRSDGGLALTIILRNQPDVDWNDSQWSLKDVAWQKAHSGAVLCCSFARRLRRGVAMEAADLAHGEQVAGAPVVAVSGDSSGQICVWGICTAQWTLRLTARLDQAHAAGVNAVRGLVLESGALVVASAGDDEEVSVRTAAATATVASTANCCVRCASTTWTSLAVAHRARHCAAAVGVEVVPLSRRGDGDGEGSGDSGSDSGLAVVSVGADQRVIASRFAVGADGSTSTRTTNVTDPAGVVVLATLGRGDREGDEGSALQVAVFGCGLEVLSVDLSGPRRELASR